MTREEGSNTAVSMSLVMIEGVDGVEARERPQSEAMTAPTPEQRVAAALEGDDEAWAALYDALAPDAHRFLVGLGALSRTEAEDALQETFVRLVRDLPRWDRARPLRPFVLGVARHVAIDALRRRRSRSAATARKAEAEPRPESERPSERLNREEVRDLIAAALEAVEPELRGLLVLRHVSNLTLRELAESCDCSVPTARERLRRAARRFAVELKNRGVLPSTWTLEVVS